MAAPSGLTASMGSVGVGCGRGSATRSARVRIGIGIRRPGRDNFTAIGPLCARVDTDTVNLTAMSELRVNEPAPGSHGHGDHGPQVPNPRPHPAARRSQGRNSRCRSRRGHRNGRGVQRTPAAPVILRPVWAGTAPAGATLHQARLTRKPGGPGHLRHGVADGLPGDPGATATQVHASGIDQEAAPVGLQHRLHPRPAPQDRLRGGPEHAPEVLHATDVGHAELRRRPPAGSPGWSVPPPRPRRRLRRTRWRGPGRPRVRRRRAAGRTAGTVRH